MTYDTTTYISTTETAKLIRKVLKTHFPDTKFSVKSHSYSMGSSINIGWTDGPASRLVKPYVANFAGSDFDSMIDLKVYTGSWLLPDGSVEIAYRPETTGSLTEIVTDAPHPDAVMVRFGADHVFCNRRESDWEAKSEKAYNMIVDNCNLEGEEPHFKFGSRWVRDLSWAMIHDHSEGEDLEAAFKRVVLLERD